MLNFEKNILAWADKEPMGANEWTAFYKENTSSLRLQMKQRGFDLRDVLNPPKDIAPRLGEVTDILVSAMDSLEYHPRIIGFVVAMSLRNKAIVKKQNLFLFLYERFLVVPPDNKIHNPQARGVAMGLANALISHFTWEHFDKAQALIKDKSLDEQRGLLLLAFKRFLHKDEVRQLLTELSEDPEHAYIAKKMLKYKVRTPK